MSDQQWAAELAQLNLTPTPLIPFSVDPHPLSSSVVIPVAEVFTVTGLSTTTFSVTGSVSGALPDGTVGVAYDSGVGVGFTVDANASLGEGNTVSFSLGGSSTPSLTETELGTGKRSFLMAPGDFDNDGDVDFIANDGELHLNDGAGNFTVQNIGTTVGGRAIHAIDFDRDGNLDFVELDFSNDLLALYRGDGTGSFTLNSNIATASFGFQASVTVGDFTGDGWEDIAIGSSSGGFSIVVSDGAGGFNAPLTPGSMTTGAAHRIAQGDLDNDGNVDLVFFSEIGGLGFLESDGSGGFNPSTNYVNAALLGGGDVGDVNGDGYDDIVVGGSAPGVYLSGPGGFGGALSTPVAGLLNSDGHLTLADLEGDGDLDIVAVTDGGYELYNNDGNSNFSLQSSVTPASRTNLDDQIPVAAELDGDGVVEFLLGRHTNGAPNNQLIVLDAQTSLSAQDLPDHSPVGTSANVKAANGLEVDGFVGPNGISVAEADLSREGLELQNLDVGSAVDARRSLERTRAALDAVGVYRATLGAASNRIDSRIEGLRTTVDGSAEARGQIEGVDFAAQTQELRRFELVNQAQTQVIGDYQRDRGAVVGTLYRTILR